MLWALARIDLGLSAAEFWRMTLRELMGLLDRKLEVRRREIDLPAALIASLFANANRDTEKRAEPFTVDDFLPRLPWEEVDEAEPAPVEVSPGQMWTKAAWLTMAFGGEITSGAPLPDTGV